MDSQSSSGPPVGGGTAYSPSPVLPHSHHNPVGDPTQLQLQGSSAVFMMLHVNVILWQNSQDHLYILPSLMSISHVSSKCPPFPQMHMSVFQSSCAVMLAMSSDDVKEMMQKLDQSFLNLKNTTRERLEKSKVVVERVADALTSLSPFNDDDHHKIFLESHVQALFKADNLSELFGTMNFHWNYLDPSLLDHLVVRFDLKAVKIQMEHYKSELHQFRMKTSLVLFCRAQKRKRINPPPDFQEMVAEFDWPETVTLEVVEQFRQEYASRYNLKECAMMVARISTGCFVITWFISESITELLREGLPEGIANRYSLLSLTIAGTCIFCHSTQVI